jgi:hypothetical protein
MTEKSEISIWFFIGLSLLGNGAVITCAGLYEYYHPPVVKVVLFDAHANIWWGALLALVGAAYCIYFSPGKRRA